MNFPYAAAARGGNVMYMCAGQAEAGAWKNYWWDLKALVRSWLASEHPDPGPLAFRQDWSTWKGCRRAKLTGETGRWGEARQVSSFQMVDTCLFFSLGKWQLKSSLLLVAGCCFPADFNKTCAVTGVRCWNWFHLSWVVVAFKTDKHGLGVEE